MLRRKGVWLCLGGLVVIAGLVAFVSWHSYYQPQAELHAAEAAAATNDLARADILLRNLIRDHPRYLDALKLYLRVLGRQGKWKEARHVFRQADQAGLSTDQQKREQTVLAAHRRLDPEAAAALRQMANETPDDVDVLELLARTEVLTQHWPDAERHFSRCLQLQPGRLDIRLERGKTRLAAVGSFQSSNEAAADDFRAILAEEPKNFEARLNLAQAFLSDARMKEAGREFEQCHELRPDRIEPLVGLAACAVERRDWPAADDLLAQALRIDPDSVMALTMRGDCYLHQGHPEKAAPLYRQVVRLAPASKSAHLKLAQALRYSGQEKEARAEEQRYLSH